jgi:hypothetical protein
MICAGYVAMCHHYLLAFLIWCACARAPAYPHSFSFFLLLFVPVRLFVRVEALLKGHTVCLPACAQPPHTNILVCTCLPICVHHTVCLPACAQPPHTNILVCTCLPICVHMGYSLKSPSVGLRTRGPTIFILHRLCARVA